MSLIRGDIREAVDQNTRRIGTVVKKASSRVVLKPPPIFHDRYAGTASRRADRRPLLKLSLPGPSAGSGAFLMAGYYGLGG